MCQHCGTCSFAWALDPRRLTLTPPWSSDLGVMDVADSFLHTQRPQDLRRDVRRTAAVLQQLADGWQRRQVRFQLCQRLLARVRQHLPKWMPCDASCA